MSKVAMINTQRVGQDTCMMANFVIYDIKKKEVRIEWNNGPESYTTRHKTIRDALSYLDEVIHDMFIDKIVKCVSKTAGDRLINQYIAWKG